MSIYSTQWEMKIRVHELGPRVLSLKEPYNPEIEWLELFCQGVLGHVGHPASGYEKDAYGDFLPPPLVGVEDYEDKLRAVVVACADLQEKDGQRYTQPLLVLSGQEYEELKFFELMERLYTSILASLEKIKEARAKRPQAMSPACALAQLRHLYAMMVNDRVQNTGSAALGLLGPALVALETHISNTGL